MPPIVCNAHFSPTIQHVPSAVTLIWNLCTNAHARDEHVALHKIELHRKEKLRLRWNEENETGMNRVSSNRRLQTNQTVRIDEKLEISANFDDFVRSYTTITAKVMTVCRLVKALWKKPPLKFNKSDQLNWAITKRSRTTLWWVIH